jgi:hypothetical protein
MTLHGGSVVALRFCIPSAVVPAVGRPEQNLGGEIPLRFEASGTEDSRAVVARGEGSDARTFSIPPKTAQYLYAAGDLPSGAVHACLLLDKLRDFDVTAKVASVTRMKVF